MSSLTQFVGAGGRIKSIQRGVVSIGAFSNSSTTTISAVDTSKSILSFLGQDTSTANAASLIFNRIAYLSLTNSTTITATANASGSSALTVSWQLVEYY
jgi:hypothetical protein